MIRKIKQKRSTLVVNGFNSTHGGGLRIFIGLLQFLGSQPEGSFEKPPVILCSPRHDPTIIKSARAMGLNAYVFRPTGIRQLDQVLLYFFYLPIRLLLTRERKCLLNLGDFIVPFVRRQVYYFDWLYAVVDVAEVWQQMTLLQYISRGIKWANIRFLINTPHVVIVQSVFVSQKISRMRYRSNPIVIPCPVDEVTNPLSVKIKTPQDHQKRTYQFLCLSSFATHKNIKILSEVGSELRSRGLQVRVILTLNEKEPAVAAFMKHINEKGLGEIITNVGVVEPGDIDRWFEACDALILPTKLESFGMPYVESLARGRPILTSNLQFAHEICKTGTLFFDPNDAIDIFDTINAFIIGGGVNIDETIVNEIVEQSKPDFVFSKILTQTII